jgi:hypothetical protein
MGRYRGMVRFHQFRSSFNSGRSRPSITSFSPQSRTNRFYDQVHSGRAIEAFRMEKGAPYRSTENAKVRHFGGAQILIR